MKKNISIVIAICLICLSETGCFFSKPESAREIEINEAVNKIYLELKKNLNDPCDLEAMNNYLISWAAQRNIAVSYDKYKNIIMSKQATHGHADDKSTLLHCKIGVPDIDNYEAVASAMFMMQNLEEHGFIRAIFTADPNEEYYGSSNISKSYLKADQVISLIQDNKTAFAIDSAAMQTYSFSKTFTKVAPTGNKAYRIAIGPFTSDSSGKIYGKHPNPIKELGDFFAYAKSRGITLELVDFSGGTSIDTYPAYATASFVINESDDTKFKRYFERNASKFLKTYDSLNETSPFAYLYSAISVPELVISKDDSTQIFSLLYTMINGSFTKDEEDVTIANTTLTRISTENAALTLNVSAREKNDTNFEEIANTLQIIAGLNDTQLNLLNNFPAWSANNNSEVYEKYKTIFSNITKKEPETRSSLQTSPIAIFKKSNPNIDALCISINFANNVTELEILEKLLAGGNGIPLH